MPIEHYAKGKFVKTTDHNLKTINRAISVNELRSLLEKKIGKLIKINENKEFLINSNVCRDSDFYTIILTLEGLREHTIKIDSKEPIIKEKNKIEIPLNSLFKTVIEL